MKTNFYIINDSITGEYVCKYDLKNSKKWQWDGDNCLDYEDIDPIHLSARFSTKESAENAMEHVKNMFKKSAESELNFEILFVEVETVMIKKSMIKISKTANSFTSIAHSDMMES